MNAVIVQQTAVEADEARPSIEDASAISSSSSVVSLEAGYRSAHFDVRFEAPNLFDSKDDERRAEPCQ